MSKPLLSNAIHHIAIICSNYTLSKYFYTQVLGFAIIREVYRDTRGSYKLDLLVNDTTQIELFSFADSPARVSNPEACGLRHVAFAVADLAVAINHLARHKVNCEPIRVDEFTHKRFTFFQDPDGLPLELYEE